MRTLESWLLEFLRIFNEPSSLRERCSIHVRKCFCLQSDLQHSGMYYPLVQSTTFNKLLVSFRLWIFRCVCEVHYGRTENSRYHCCAFDSSFKQLFLCSCSLMVNCILLILCGVLHPRYREIWWYDFATFRYSLSFNSVGWGSFLFTMFRLPHVRHHSAFSAFCKRGFIAGSLIITTQRRVYSADIIDCWQLGWIYEDFTCL